jgi:uncharacterized RDD family membrane protein YckC
VLHHEGVDVHIRIVSPRPGSTLRDVEPYGPALVSGEGVRLALTPAGIGSRVIATLVDAGVQFGALFVLLVLDGAVANGADTAAVAAVVIVESVLVVAGYPIVVEWLTRGRTLGKGALGLRVVRDDGGPIGFRHALVRGLAGLFIEKPGLLFPGLIAMASNPRDKRIGDMMAGTVVLNERSGPHLLAAIPNWVPPHLVPWVLSLDMHRLDDRLALSARQFVTRAHGMTYAAQATLGEELRARVLAVTSPPPPPGTPTPELLVSVLAERRRRASLPADTSAVRAPASRPRPAAAPPPDPDGPFAPPR